MRTACFAVLLCACAAPMTWPSAAVEADALRIDELRQDVLEMQRAVRDLRRRLERLEETLAAERARPRGGVEETRRAPAAPLQQPLEWLSAEKWRRIAMGMPESEALAILGAPTATRTTPSGVRTLFYSMELQAGGFLSGRIVVEDGRVTAVSPPALR